MWAQHQITLRARPRGVHLVSDEICRGLDGLGSCQIGLLHLFIQHTSASLAINENACADVRDDVESWLNATMREREPYYTHTYEGDDDMPAHLKALVIGPGLTIPIAGGRLALGTWQGVYLCEHRDHGGARRIVATINGE